ncbi:hypothetical protein WJX73_007475 [Symbiochloris irregularis]|uniref:HTH myb-type domain-containing protein n=1 Tax=Symbiochloris irregularis TaxID=706552 RepID=A0AAW1PZ86_9CHLO
MTAAVEGFEPRCSKADSSKPTDDSPALDQVTIVGAQASAALDNKSTASTDSLLVDCSSTQRRAGRASETQLTARAFGASSDNTRALHSDFATSFTQPLDAASAAWLPELSQLDVCNPMSSTAEGSAPPNPYESQPQFAAVQPVTLTEVQLPAIPLFGNEANAAPPNESLEQQQSSHSPNFQDAVDALLTASQAHSWGSYSRPTTPYPLDQSIQQAIPIDQHHLGVPTSQLQEELSPGNSLWPDDAQVGDKRALGDDGVQEGGFWGADDDDEGGPRGKRPRLVWTPELHTRFINAVTHLGLKNAVPKTILQLMNVEGMTRENVASHLQKYRLHLKRGAGYPAGARLSPDTLQQLQQDALQQLQQEQYTTMFPAFVPPPIGTMPHSCYPSPVPAMPMGSLMPPGLTPVPPMAVYPFPWMGMPTQAHLPPQLPNHSTCGPPLFSPHPMGAAMGIQPLVQHAIPLSPSTASGGPQWVWGAPSPQQQLQIQQQMQNQGISSSSLRARLFR